MTLSLFIYLMLFSVAGLVLGWFLNKSRSNYTQLDANCKDLITKRDLLQNELSQALQDKVEAKTELTSIINRYNELTEQKKIADQDIEAFKRKIHELETSTAEVKVQLEEKSIRLQEQQEFIKQADQKLKDAFVALSADVLKHNNESFITLADTTLKVHLKEAKGDLEKKQLAIEQIVSPLNESLKTMDNKIQELEKSRVAAYSGLSHYLDHFKITTDGLKKETTNLVGALKTSYTRGRYGEIALRRLVEFTGMIDRCHFREQVTVEDSNGRLRPDMIIELPEHKKLVVDSKVPLDAYLKMFETDDMDQQRIFLKRHTEAVKDHLKKLSAKAYWSQFEEAPDFVIMYLHIESSFGSALEACPDLIEEAFTHRIIIATPTILISILMSIGYSWNQIHTMENIEEIRTAAVELYERSSVYIDHMSRVGNSLEGTVKHFNNAVGSLEGNFMPQARRINALSQGYTKKILEQLEPVELIVRKNSVSGIEVDERES